MAVSRPAPREARVKFKLILYLRRRVGHSTSFADPFVFVTARLPTPLSAYKSFRQVANKRRVLMDLRGRERRPPVSSRYRLILFARKRVASPA